MSESCSEQSLIQSESLVGTAPGPITHWICIEMPGAWPSRFKPNTLSLPPALAALTDIAGRPHHKLLLIRGRRPTARKTIRVFVSQPALDRVRSWEVDFSGPFIDWDSRLKQDSGHHLTHPLILVCTHGSRDRCCGILGGATFAALHTINPDWVWQVSHLGGHRFAPTLLSLPSGQLYGRVTADMAVDFMNALSRGEPFDFGHLRGNTQFAPAVQAVLAHLGRQTADSFTVKQEAEYTRVKLFHGDESVVAVAQRCPTGQSACASCADVTPRPIMRWHVEVETA